MIKCKKKIFFYFRWYDSGPQIAHYTQIVWADTEKVGCGIVSYNTVGSDYKLTLICNYGPTGNWIGEKVYEIA